MHRTRHESRRQRLTVAVIFRSCTRRHLTKRASRIFFQEPRAPAYTLIPTVPLVAMQLACASGGADAPSATVSKGIAERTGGRPAAGPRASGEASRPASRRRRTDDAGSRRHRVLEQPRVPTHAHRSRRRACRARRCRTPAQPDTLDPPAVGTEAARSDGQLGDRCDLAASTTSRRGESRHRGRGRAPRAGRHRPHRHGPDGLRPRR